MPNIAWTPLSASVPAFTAFRRDEAVIRTLQGSQVALHEYRMAYENLVSVFTRERHDWSREKEGMEDELREMKVRSAEVERQLKERLATAQARAQMVKEALAQLEGEHRELRASSEQDISDLLDRVEVLQQTVAELEDEGQQLRSELASTQEEAAGKEEAVQRAEELQVALGGLQQRAQQMVEELEQERAVAEHRADSLSSDLSAMRAALAAQAVARTAAEAEAARLALQQRRLERALAVERLINEPLRHTHFATTTTVAHVMRSPVAPTVRDRAAHPQQERQEQQMSPTVSTQAYGTGTLEDWLASGRPSTAPPPAHTAGSSFTFSPRRSPAPEAEAPSMEPDISGLVRGKTLTRLARSWATTTPAAGHPHPAFPDNISSAISPPPPSPLPQRRAATGTGDPSPPPRVAASPYATPPRPRTAPGQRPGAAGASGLAGSGAGVGSSGATVGGGGVWSAVPRFRPLRAEPAEEYVVPRHRTSMPRSPRSPSAAAAAAGGREGAAVTAARLTTGTVAGRQLHAVTSTQPVTARLTGPEPASAAPRAPRRQLSAQASPRTPAAPAHTLRRSVTQQRRSATPQSGRAAMRAAVKEPWSSGVGSPASGRDSPATVVYA